MNLRKLIALGLLWAAATGQKDAAKESSMEASVPDYSTLAQSWFRNNLKDFESAKIQQIKPPEPGTWGNRGGLLVRRSMKPSTFHCYRVNAKNSYGAYTGWATYLLIEQEGLIAQVRSSPYFNQYAGRELDDEEVTKLC